MKFGGILFTSLLGVSILFLGCVPEGDSTVGMKATATKRLSQPSTENRLAVSQVPMEEKKVIGEIKYDPALPIVVDEGGAVRITALVSSKSGDLLKNLNSKFELVIADSDSGGALLKPRSENFTDLFGRIGFMDVYFDKPGRYRLKIQSGSIASEASEVIVIGEAQSKVIDGTPITKRPRALNFKQVVSEAASRTFLKGIAVGVYDENGNPALDAKQSITLSLETNSGSSVLYGRTTEIPVNGIAQFDSLMMDQPGRGYRLKAEAPGFEPALSNLFNLTATNASQQLTQVTVVDVYVMCQDATKLEVCPVVPKDWAQGWSADRVQDVLVKNTNPFFIHDGSNMAGFVLGRIKRDYADGFYNFGKVDTTKLKSHTGKVGRKGNLSIFIVNSIEGAGAFATEIFGVASSYPAVVIPSKNFTLSQGSYYSDVMAHEFGHLLGIHHLAANESYQAQVKLCGENYEWTVLEKSQATVCASGRCDCAKNHTMSYAAVDLQAYKGCGLSKFFVEPGFKEIKDVPAKMHNIMSCWNRSSYY